MGEKTSEMTRENFLGAWELVSYEFRESGGKVIKHEAQALLIYDKSGYVSVQLMRPGRLTFKSGDPYRATAEEMKSAFEGFVSYYGTYEIDNEQGTVTHHIKASLFPNLVGTHQARSFSFSGNQITLSTTPTIEKGIELVKVMVWQRIT